MSKEKENFTPKKNTNAIIMGKAVEFENTDGETKVVPFPNYEAAYAFCKKNSLKT